MSIICLYMQARDTDKALDAFTRAVQIDPDNGEAWNNVACLYDFIAFIVIFILCLLISIVAFIGVIILFLLISIILSAHWENWLHLHFSAPLCLTSLKKGFVLMLD